MTHLRSTTANDTNRELQNHLFGADNNKLQLTENWGMGDKCGANYMHRNGYEVLSLSIKAYLNGTFTSHRYLHDRVSNSQDGISTMSAEDCSCLKSIVGAKTNNAKHVMVLRAVRRKILSPDVIQFSCGARAAVRPLETMKAPSAPKPDNGIEVMLVDSKKEPEEQKEAKAPSARAKKRRRKGDAEVAKPESEETST